MNALALQTIDISGTAECTFRHQRPRQFLFVPSQKLPPGQRHRGTALSNGMALGTEVPFVARQELHTVPAASRSQLSSQTTTIPLLLFLKSSGTYLTEKGKEK